MHVASREDADAGYYGGLAHRIAFNATVTKSIENVPFDYYCPSVSSTVGDRTCKDCHAYFPIKRGLTLHKKIHKRRKNPSLAKLSVNKISEASVSKHSDDGEDADEGSSSVENAFASDGSEEEDCDGAKSLGTSEEGNDIHIIDNFSQWNSSPFIEVLD